MMLVVDHFKRPFVDAVLESIKKLDESYDQDINKHKNLNTKVSSI